MRFFYTALIPLQKAFSPGLWPAWALVLVTGGAVCIALKTLEVIQKQGAEIQRQARAAETSAEAAATSALAARTSAEALLRADRAWLTLDKREEPWLVPAIEQPNPIQPRISSCIVEIKNYGKTPAWVTGWNFGLQLGDRKGPSDISVFDLGKGTFNPSIVPQGTAIQLEASLSSGIISAQERDEVLKKRTTCLWLCGIVRYRDVFREEPEHETSFCYVYETLFNTPKPFWRPAGPPEYNRTT